MGWKIGIIKFYNEEKGFGFIRDNEEFYNEEIHCRDNKEFYFRKLSLRYKDVKKDDLVYFKKDDNGKDLVNEIHIIDKAFLISKYEFIDYNLLCDLNGIIRTGQIKDFDKYFKEFINKFTDKLNAINVYDDLSFKKNDNIENYIDNFILDLHIIHNTKVGDDETLSIFYKLQSLDNISVSNIEIENFEYSLYSFRGLCSFQDVKENFIATEKEHCESIIPEVLEKIKQELLKNYKIGIYKNYRHSLKYLFEQEIYKSFFEIGIAKTIGTADIIFNRFKEECKSSKYYTIQKNVIKK